MTRHLRIQGVLPLIFKPIPRWVKNLLHPKRSLGWDKNGQISSLVGGPGPPLWKIWLRQLGWLYIPNISGKISKMATKPPTRSISSKYRQIAEMEVSWVIEVPPFSSSISNDGIFPNKSHLFWGSPVYGNPQMNALKQDITRIVWVHAGFPRLNLPDIRRSMEPFFYHENHRFKVQSSPEESP